MLSLQREKAGPFGATDVVVYGDIIVVVIEVPNTDDKRLETIIDASGIVLEGPGMRMLGLISSPSEGVIKRSARSTQVYKSEIEGILLR